MHSGFFVQCSFLKRWNCVRVPKGSNEFIGNDNRMIMLQYRVSLCFPEMYAGSRS